MRELLRILIPLLLFFAGCGRENLNPVSPESPAPEKEKSLPLSDSLVLDTGRLSYDLFLQNNTVKTGLPLDMAVTSDNGFFILKKGDSLCYLRRPARFFIDKDGYVVKDSGGPRLMGFKGNPDLTAALTDPGYSVPESMLVEIRLPPDAPIFLRPEPRPWFLDYDIIKKMQMAQINQSFPETLDVILPASAPVQTQYSGDLSSNMVLSQLEPARDSSLYDASMMVYDDSGVAHTLTIQFSWTGVHYLSGQIWKWKISAAGNEAVLQGQTGNVWMSSGGGAASVFSFDEPGISTIRINPNNGSGIIDITLDTSPPGAYHGITSFNSNTSSPMDTQNSYSSGRLEEISIVSFGQIAGATPDTVLTPQEFLATLSAQEPVPQSPVRELQETMTVQGIVMEMCGLIDSVYLDGTTVPLFKIATCRFPSQEGLAINGDYFSKTTRSGDPVYGDGLVFGFKPGVYELDQ